MFNLRTTLTSNRDTADRTSNVRQTDQNAEVFLTKDDRYLGDVVSEETNPLDGLHPIHWINIHGQNQNIAALLTGDGDDIININVGWEDGEMIQGSIEGVSTGGGDDTIYINSIDSHDVGYINTGDGEDEVTLDNGLIVWGVDTGDDDDEVYIEGGSFVFSIDTGAGDDIVGFSAGGAAIVELGDGNDTFNASGNSYADSIDGGEGNDTFNLSNNAAIDELNGGSGDDTVNLDLTDIADYYGSNGNPLAYDGGTGDEDIGDTINITYDGEFQSVTFDPETGVYTVTLENGATFTITNFENINWPDDFNTDLIEILGEPGPEANDDPIGLLFFDDATSAQMIADQDVKPQAEQDDGLMDMFI